MRFDRRLLLAAGCAIGALTPASFAFAQDAAPEGPSAGAISEVVVTARRREEALQEVPVAVTAVTGQELESRSVRDIMDIASVAPNLQIGQASRGGAVAVVNLRGQENTGLAITNDPAVGIYFDEVYLGRSAGSLLAGVVDMSSVQVLRGPQGTLFGRNNTGGAILLTPNRPDLNEFGGSLTLNYGSYNHFEGTAILNAPLVEDKLALRVVYQNIQQDGIGRSLTTGVDTYGDRNRSAGRVALRWEPSEYATIDFTYDSTLIDEAGPLTAPMGASAATVNLPVGLGYYETRAGVFPSSTAGIDGYTLRGEFEINPDLAVKAIIGRRLLSTAVDLDVDNGPGGTAASPATGTDSFQYAHQSQWTFETQVSGTTLRDVTPWITSVDFTGGFFYFTETGIDNSQVPNTTVALTTGRTLQNYATNGSAAGYLQAELNSNDKLFFTAGARYTKDRRELRIRTAVSGACGLTALPPGTPLSVCFQSGDADFDYWSFTAGVRYEINPNANVYFKYDKGQRAGGLDDTPRTIEPFFPEVVDSYEFGAKMDLLDRRLRTNLAVFYASIDNVQRSTLLVDVLGNPYSSVFNAAASETKGIELEVTAVPVTGLTLQGSLGLIDAEYTEFTDVRPTSPAVIVNGRVLSPAVVRGADISYLKFPNTPDTTWSLSAAYETQVGELGDLMLRADYAHRSKVYLDTFNNELATQKPYGLLNARVQLDLAKPVMGAGLSLALWGKNLTDTEYTTAGSPAAGGVFMRADNRRMYGVELKAAF